MAMEALAIETERRGHQRYFAHVDVNIAVGNEASGGLLVGTSLEGLRIRTPRLIKPSTDVVISFFNEEDVVILAGIVWVLDKIKKGLPSYMAGLQIYSIKVGKKDLQGMAERTAFLQDLQP